MHTNNAALQAMLLEFLFWAIDQNNFLIYLHIPWPFRGPQVMWEEFVSNLDFSLFQLFWLIHLYEAVPFVYISLEHLIDLRTAFLNHR